jgi:hypothetical protein
MMSIKRYSGGRNMFIKQKHVVITEYVLMRPVCCQILDQVIRANPDAFNSKSGFISAQFGTEDTYRMLFCPFCGMNIIPENPEGCTCTDSAFPDDNCYFHGSRKRTI